MTPSKRFRISAFLISVSMIISLVLCSEPITRDEASVSLVAKPAKEAHVKEYLRLFPYQETNRRMHYFTRGDSSLINDWAIGKEPMLVQAGRDSLPWADNDVYYKIAFIDLTKGPVTLSSKKATRKRFNSFQILDDRNVTFRTILYPDKRYILYRGDKEPKRWGAESIKAPADHMVVIARVEVTDSRDPVDRDKAAMVYKNMTVEGRRMYQMPELNLLSGFDRNVIQEAHRRMDVKDQDTPGRRLVISREQLGDKVDDLTLATAAKRHWGKAAPHHISEVLIDRDKDGVIMKGDYGSYKLTTKVPPVGGFWSITVYDQDGHLHPNPSNRYSVNGHTARYNTDGTVTIRFREDCSEAGGNCLQVPNGRFKLMARFYDPDPELERGEWKLPPVQLDKKDE